VPQSKKSTLTKFGTKADLIFAESSTWSLRASLCVVDLAYDAIVVGHEDRVRGKVVHGESGSVPICLGLASFPSPRAWVDAIP